MKRLYTIDNWPFGRVHNNGCLGRIGQPDGYLQVHSAVPGGLFGAPAFVTQNGDAVNLVTESGESYRAWPDWSAPTSRIWIEARNEGAVFSPDGMRIQFDDGRVWQRELGPPPPVVFRRSPVIWQR
jgi:hypothetical protein